MFARTVLLSATLTLIATPAFPCSVIGPLPTGETLVRRSDVIVRVRAEAVKPGSEGTPSPTATPTQIAFRVLEVLKGELSSATVSFNGVVAEQDDHNDRPVPYDFVRPGGRHGNCYALEYRLGAEYLLLLHQGSGDGPPALTPYWAALAPTNEQLFGVDDPWYAWVRREVGR